jgi:hypothetical protein
MSQDQLKDVQKERGNVYGKFIDHSKAVDQIVDILKTVNMEKQNFPISVLPKEDWPEGFETAVFYMVSKLVRLATTPNHIDSALDLSSYADLWLKIIEEQDDEKSNKTSKNQSS